MSSHAAHHPLTRQAFFADNASQKFVAVLPDHKSKLESEGDVYVDMAKACCGKLIVISSIRATVPFFSNVLEVVAPVILEGHGHPGKFYSLILFEYCKTGADFAAGANNLEWRSEMTMKGESKKRPDVTLKYKTRDKPLFCLDYKGPNCIQVDELNRAGATSIAEAERLRDELRTKRENRDNIVIDSLFDDARSKYISNSTRNLIKQAIKYGGA